MGHASGDLIARTRELWGPRYGQEIMDEEAREILDNMVAFAELIIDRYMKEKESDCDSVKPEGR